MLHADTISFYAFVYFFCAIWFYVFVDMETRAKRIENKLAYNTDFRKRTGIEDSLLDKYIIQPYSGYIAPIVSAFWLPVVVIFLVLKLLKFGKFVIIGLAQIRQIVSVVYELSRKE